MKLILLLSVLSLGTQQQGPALYTGMWNNSRAKTNGNLSVMIMPTGESKWKAKFKGEFQGDPFDYEMDFTTKPEIKKDKETGNLKIQGRANVESQMYMLSGWMNDNTFYGRFSSSGPNGDFRLSRKMD